MIDILKKGMKTLKCKEQLKADLKAGNFIFEEDEEEFTSREA